MVGFALFQIGEVRRRTHGVIDIEIGQQVGPRILPISTLRFLWQPDQ